MNEVVREFLLETHENLAKLDLDLVTLERDPTERETLARVFRTLHTVKGTAGFLGLPKLQAVAHAAENLLTRLRAGDPVFNPEVASVLLSVVDAIRRMLQQLEKDGGEGDGDYSALIYTLDNLRSGGEGAEARGRSRRPPPRRRRPRWKAAAPPQRRCQPPPCRAWRAPPCQANRKPKARAPRPFPTAPSAWTSVCSTS